MARRRTAFAYAMGALLIILVGFALTIDGFRYRLSVVGHKVAGRLPDIGWGDLYFMLDPRSGMWVEPLAVNPNPNISITRPDATEHDARAGREIFLARCAGCHAADAGGATAPALVGRILTHGDSDWAIYQAIRSGVLGTAMAAQPLSRGETWQVVAHLRAIAHARDEPRANTPDDRRAAFSPVTFERLKRTDSVAGEDGWLTYSGSYNGQRHTPLTQINRGNVARLRVSWIRPIAQTGDVVQSTPLVNGDILFVTAPPQRVIAMSARSGKILWEYSRSLPTGLARGYGTINRGVALFGRQVFIGTLDAHLIALDAESGQLRWDIEVAPSREDYSITGAPLAIDGLVVTGISGGDYATRGFIDAYDAETGQRRWRFYSIPGPGEPGSDTWPDQIRSIGGAATWLTGSFDSESNRVIWGVGNPSPTYAGDMRPGDNLYSNSVVALDAASGRLAWYFQFTPHDEHDWDSAQIPVLANLSPWGGLPKTLLWANRNGFFYALDGLTGAFRTGMPFARQNWAHGLDKAGRPIRVAGASPSATGTLVYPRQSGATTWWSPAFSPSSGLFYVPSFDGSSLFFRSATTRPRRGEQYLLGSWQTPTGDPPVASVKALSPATGELVWEYRPSSNDHRPARGLLSTGGGLVFASHDTRLVALDAASGAELWQFDTGQPVQAAPISFLVEGRQHVAVAAGALLLTFNLPVD
jgi:alcohol dehydrogenase (cytochrome c)